MGTILSPAELEEVREEIEIVMPATTTARAEPVLACGTMTVAAPTAVGENMAAPKPARALVAKAIV